MELDLELELQVQVMLQKLTPFRNYAYTFSGADLFHGHYYATAFLHQVNDGVEEVHTNADLSDKTESATSFAFHAFFSFEVKKRELGGPICTKNIKGVEVKLES